MGQPLSVEPGKKIRLDEFDPAHTSGLDKAQAAAETQQNVAVLDELSYRLYAENKRALLLILQGMDTAGKDGVIRKVMTGIDPVSCQVTSFKQPSVEELDHDFLWRVHRAVPARGDVGIFNRSHYEDVLVVRVHKLVREGEWKSRYERINEFEKILTEGGTTIVKCYLHIGKEEQRRRLQARLDDRKKRWKFSKNDLAERKLWDKYREAYDDALTKCNTEHAPWYVVPADHKWHRDLIISRILRETLEQMDPRYPDEEEGLDQIVVE
ncbi:MAG: polyphosphate kinase 2 family protein [Planctomycetia bacterium]|nr:polyphosphate kinase 2 family protein [Planctomycetia bacterium]